MFSSARQLIGLHGAALANIVWAQEGSNVCEIFSSAYMPGCYSTLTAIRAGATHPVSYTAGAENMIDVTTTERLALIGYGDFHRQESVVSVRKNPAI
jgi:capsular polysaccharide biosynthesis protein